MGACKHHYAAAARHWKETHGATTQPTPPPPPPPKKTHTTTAPASTGPSPEAGRTHRYPCTLQRPDSKPNYTDHTAVASVPQNACSI